jgi:uncharacterized protein
MASSTNQIIELVKKYLLILKEKNIPVQKAVLFGSYVKGNYREDSDIDIAIVSNVFKGDRFLDRKMVVPLRRGLDSRIEPMPFTPDDFSRGGALINEKKKTGQAIQL